MIKKQGRDKGFTLIEVLVALIVLSFGVLGMVGLQANALQSNRDARLQSAAGRLGREISELMRANATVASQTTSAANPYLVDFSGTLPTTTTNCFSAACTSTADVASYDIREWLTRVNNELPGARVVICFDATPYTSGGLPQWTCSNTGGTLMIKIGWTRQGLNRATTASEALVKATAPTVVLPFTAATS